MDLQGHELIIASFENINKDGEVLTKSTHCKHVVPWIPLTIRDKVQHFALIWNLRNLLLQKCAPDAWLTVLRARDKELCIRRDGESDHEFLAVCTEESLLNAGSLS